MKISKFTGSDMRQALRVVREQLGAEAVILSSRTTEDGIEITAAVDFDLEPPQAAVVTAPGTSPLPFAETLAAARASASSTLQSRAEPASDRDALGNELKTLRRILETQVAQLAWNDLSRRAPIHTEILRELTEVGLKQELASQVVAQLPVGIDLTQARRLCIALISKHLPVTGDRWLEDGGCLALIGPTGVGKTTTLAKLAVRWVLRHGPRDMALISADAVRIGAHDPIRALGQMLGVEVHVADSLSELPALLAKTASRRLILVDTPGLSQRDPQLATHLNQLAAAGPQLKTALVLAASTQAGAIEEIVRRFAPAKPACCLLTKMDEATTLGGVISVLTQVQLPVSYTSEGQRVPEDLRPARALELVSSAVQLAQVSGAAADEDLLSRRFGEIAHALA